MTHCLFRIVPPRIAPSLLAVAVLVCLMAPAARAQWSVDVTVERFSWHEDVSPLDVREVGPRVGGGVGFLQRRERGFLFGVHANLYGGHVNYEGSLLLDPAEPAQGVTAYLGSTQTAELRHRWAGAADAVAALELDLWRRYLSSTQREEYRILSLRLGVDRPVARRGAIAAGGGVRWLLDTHERATFSGTGVQGQLTLVPGLGWNPYVNLGCGITPHLAARLYWDGMRLERSKDLVVDTGGGSQVVVFQPATDANVLGLRLTYAF